MKTKQKLPLHFHYISALLLFVVMFGVAYVSQSFAESEPEASTEKLVEACVARIFELDRSVTFSDVGQQEWYTHAVNFLVLLDENLATIPDHGENEAPRLPTFLPTQAVRTDEFAKWVSSFSLLFDDSRKESLAKFSSRSKKKMTASTVSQMIAKKIRVPQKTMKEIVKQQKISGKYVTKAEAAFLLLQASKHALKASPEKTICAKHAEEDLEQFKVLFGLTAEGNETPTPAPLAPIPVTPAATSAPLRIAELSFSEKGPKAGDSVTVRVSAQHADATPAIDAALQLVLSTGRDYEKTYPLLMVEADRYEAAITSEWAGTYQAGVRQGGVAVGASQSLTFQPADPATVALKLATPQEKSTSKQEAVIKASLRDRFGNVIDSEVRDYRVTTSLGKIKSVQKQDGEVFITVSADAWGEAAVLVSHLTQNVQDASSSISVPFSAVILDIPKGVQTGASLTVPVYVFLPPQSGKIGGYRFTLNYEKEDFTLQEVTDGNTSDAFPAPTLTRGEGTIRLAANTRALPSEQVIHAANLQFLANTVAGSGTTFISEGVIINEQEKVVALPESSGTGESLRRWWNNVKPAKGVCLDIWIADDGVSRAEALSDVQKASDMFKKAADASFCPFFINWTTNFHHISAADWSTKVNNGTTTAELGDDADLRANFAGSAECVQIWYVPDIARLPNGVDPIALSYPGNGGIAIDDSADYDDLTLGHELAHQLSGNDVLDSPDDAGNTQGARDHGNPMNYDHPGDNFSKAQCDLIKQPPYIK